MKIPFFQKLRLFPKIVLLFIIFILLGGFGVALGIFPPAVRDSISFLPIPVIAENGASSREDVQGYIYKMEPFIVNLADAGQLRFLKIKIDLEGREAKPHEEYERRMPQLRDTILTILCSKQSQDILNASGKQKLREEIKNSANQVLRHSRVKAVYITEFMVQ